MILSGHDSVATGEMFLVLKETEPARFGQHGTRRFVLEAWERQNHNQIFLVTPSRHDSAELLVL